MNTIQSRTLKLLKPSFLRACLFALLIIFTTSSCTNYNLRRAKSEEMILRFSKGTLLIRLKSDGNRIQKIQKIKGVEAAQEAKRKLREENEQLMYLIKSNYSFTPYYFFYSEDSGPLRDKKFEEVRFLQANGERVATPNLDFYMVGHMGTVHDQVLTVRREGEEDLQMAGGTGGVSGFIIMNDEYVEMDDYLRFGQYWGFKRIEPMGDLLNGRLEVAQRRTYKRERFLTKYNERQARKKKNRGEVLEGN